MSNAGSFTREGTLGKNNPKWKGAAVGYFALHTWVSRSFGKAKKCEACGSLKWVQWANRSGKYRRERKDWLQLCSICHRVFDGITKFTKGQAAKIRTRYERGETQTAMAKEFGVDQSTLSKIINHKGQFYG